MIKTILAWIGGLVMSSFLLIIILLVIGAAKLKRTPAHRLRSAKICSRAQYHIGPCNGYPRDECQQIGYIANRLAQHASPNDRAVKESLGHPRGTMHPRRN